jgi:hypothetical protein
VRENLDRAARGLPTINFWYAERDEEQPSNYQWTPVMQWDGMIMGGAGIFFATQRECEEFIRDEIVSAVAHFEQLKTT